MNALKIAVKRFFEKHHPRMTRAEFEQDEKWWATALKKSNQVGGVSKMSRIGSGKKLTYQEWQKLNQDSLNDCLDNNRISAHLIAVLRWERFKDFNEKQQSRAENRKPQD